MITVAGIAAIAVTAFAIVNYLRVMRHVAAEHRADAVSLAAGSINNGWVTAFDEIAEIIQFATGNLNPETIIGWPHEKLREIAETYLKLTEGAKGDVQIHHRELCQELLRFADEAQALEAARPKKVATPATLADFGPQTEEAKAIWAKRTGQTGQADNEK